MRRLWLPALLWLSWQPAWAGLARVALPSAALAQGVLSAPAALSASAALAPSAPLSSPALSAPALAPSLPAALAPVPAAPRIAGTDTGLISASDVTEGLAELRRASHEVHPQVAEIVARINARYPELPVTSENLFLVRDRALLERLGIPENAAGAARIVSDGRRETPVVILAAARPVPLDEFVEYAVHEAVHLMDDGILRVRHDAELKHFFAEGWTQKRTVVMANEILAGLGRPATPGKAYHREISLVEAFIARHGSAPLDELVRRGSDAGLRRALGPRWDLAARIIASEASRARRVDVLTALISADRVGPAEELALLDYVR